MASKHSCCTFIDIYTVHSFWNTNILSKQYGFLKTVHYNGFIMNYTDLHQKWREWQCMSDLLTLGIHQWKTSSSLTQNLTPGVANSLLSPCILLNYEKRKTKCPYDFIRYFNFNLNQTFSLDHTGKLYQLILSYSFGYW